MQPDSLYGAIHVGNRWVICNAYFLDWQIMADVACDNLFVISEGEVVLTQACIDRVNSCRLDEDINEYISMGCPPSDLPWLMVCVDLEKRLFVNGYFELPIEDYVPDGWVGRFGDPYDFVPEYIAERWRKCFDYKEQSETRNTSLLHRIWKCIRGAVQVIWRR